MQIYQLDQPAVPEQFAPCVVAIGEFDGVHLGHQEVIRRALNLAQAKGAKSAVMTFSPHPRAVIGKDSRYIHQLTPLSEKAALIEALGIDDLFVVNFTSEFASIDPRDFIARYLVPLPAAGVVTGFDFRFGKQAKGTAEDLIKFGNEFGFQAEIVEPVLLEGIKISSSGIREQLAEGDVAAVNRWIGRRYGVQGEVVHGDKRGRLIGFPTANLSFQEPFVLPQNGVYAVTVHLEAEAQTRWGVVNIGTRPTFKTDGMPSVEVHLLDFDGDLYGHMLQIKFVKRLRAEQKFPSIEMLVKQLHLDVAQARQLSLVSQN